MLLRREALAHGVNDNELARLRRRGELRSLQRGAYVAAEHHATLQLAQRHRLAIEATVAGLRVPGIISHRSAAVLHGLPLWPAYRGPVEITRAPPAWTGHSARLRIHVARLAEDEIALIDGLLVTALPRTLLDLGRLLSLDGAVVAADFALHSGSVTDAELSRCLARMRGIPGSRKAADLVSFADAGAASVGESRSRVALARLGLPRPVLQLEIRDQDGRRIAITDFGWPEEGVVGEFDGRVKYGRLLRPGQQAGDAVFEEKRREDAIRDTGWEVARWTWGDLDDRGVIGARLDRARSRAARRAPR